MLNFSDAKCKSYYDVLDEVRRRPALLLGGIDEDWIRGTRMSRLQAFLSGLHFAGLDQGDPPFHDFGPWFAVRVDGIPASHNLPFHWLEERERGSDAAFDTYFALLDEYRLCHSRVLTRSRGPFRPKFTVGLDSPRPPDHPDAIVVARYEPSDVHYWAQVHGESVERSFPFFRTKAAALRDAAERWGIERDSWRRS